MLDDRPKKSEVRKRMEEFYSKLSTKDIEFFTSMARDDKADESAPSESGEGESDQEGDSHQTGLNSTTKNRARPPTAHNRQRKAFIKATPL